MTAEPLTKWTFEDYLAYDRQTEARYELYDGEIFAMSGATRKHNLVNGNLYSALRPLVMKRGYRSTPVTCGYGSPIRT